MPATYSTFASTVQGETAFTVLAVAKRLLAAGKDVIELEIGDSPFPTSPAALDAGVRAVREGHTHYGPSLGMPDFRGAAAAYLEEQYGLPVTAAHVVVGPGAKIYEQFFCEAFVNPGDGGTSLQPALPHLSREHPAARGPDGGVAAARLPRLPAEPRRRRALPRRGPEPEGDLPQQSPQPDRRGRNAGGSGRARRA